MDVVADFFADLSPELLLAKLLSLGVVAGALVGKLPQVYAIWKARSAAGISAVSMWMEAFSLGVQFSYNVVRCTPISTYAEVPILFLQVNLLALTAAWAEGYLGPRVWAGSLGLALGTAAMCLELVPVAATAALYAANAAVSVAIIGPQLVMTCRNRSTGQLSFIVAAMTFSGLTTRLFTTLLEVDDLELRIGVCLNWLLMAVLLLQFLIFRPRDGTPASPTKVAVDEEERPVPAADVWGGAPSAPLLSGPQSALGTPSSLVDCVSNIGSSRCLYLLGDGALEQPTARGLKEMRNRSWDSFRPPVDRLRRSFHSLQSFSGPF